MGQESHHPPLLPSSWYCSQGEGCPVGGQMLWLGILNPTLSPSHPSLQGIHQNPILPVLWLAIFLSSYNEAWDSKHIQCLGGRPLNSNMLDLGALYEPDCFSQNSTSISSIFTLAKYSGRRRRFKIFVTDFTQIYTSPFKAQPNCWKLNVD